MRKKTLTRGANKLLMGKLPEVEQSADDGTKYIAPVLGGVALAVGGGAALASKIKRRRDAERMQNNLNKEAFDPTDLIHTYNSLPHMPWEQIVPSIPVSASAAKTLGTSAYYTHAAPTVDSLRAAVHKMQGLPPPDVLAATARLPKGPGLMSRAGTFLRGSGPAMRRLFLRAATLGKAGSLQQKVAAAAFLETLSKAASTESVRLRDPEGGVAVPFALRQCRSRTTCEKG